VYDIGESRSGFYREGKNKEEVDKLVNITKELELYQSGIACFKCNQEYFKYISKAIDSNTYCVAFGIDKSCLYKSNKESDPAILYVEWDSETG